MRGKIHYPPSTCPALLTMVMDTVDTVTEEGADGADETDDYAIIWGLWRGKERVGTYRSFNRDFTMTKTEKPGPLLPAYPG